MNGWPDHDGRHVFLGGTHDPKICILCMKSMGDMNHISEEAYNELRNTYATALTHPVDILKDLGVPFTPEQEAKARGICDGEVE